MKHIIATLIPLSLLSCSEKKIEQQPNIVFFLMDDLGYGDLGCMGQKLIETPNIDKLAMSGKILTQHYSGSPVSAPSRCVLMTGLHTGHSQIRGNDEWRERGAVWSHEEIAKDSTLEGQRPMAADTKTLAHYLSEAGYVTSCIGKWGLGAPGTVSEPSKMGFSHFYGYNCQRQAHTYFPTHLYKNSERIYLNNNVLQPGTRLNKEDNPLDSKSYVRFNQKQYAPDLMMQETLNFIEENSNRPFFLWWTTPLPHVSLQAPQNLIDYYVNKFGDEEPFLGDSYFPCRYPRATYAAMVTYIDNQVGEIIEKLKERGIYENTIIVFTSDNGPTFNGGTDSSWFDSAHPFKSERGRGKGSLMEGGIRVPTIVSWPGKIEAGEKDNQLSGFQDWMPTLLDMVGLNNKTPQPCDGISLKPMLLGDEEKNQHQFLYWEYPENGGSIAVRKGEWKLIVKNIRKEPRYFLYNLNKDPLEELNLANEKEDIVKELKILATESHTTPENKNFEMGLPLQ